MRIRHLQGPLAVGVALLVGVGCPAAGASKVGSGVGSPAGSASGQGSATVGDSMHFRETFPDATASASGSAMGEEPDDATLAYTPPPSGSEGRCGAGKTNPKGTCDCPPGFASVGKPGDARCVARAAGASASASASGKPSATGTSGLGRCPRGSEICE